jgi:inner membrane protein
MASLFTHALVGTALGQAGTSDWRKDWRFWCLIIVCSILPDLDSIGFYMGVPYRDLWGHRGMMHSVVFAAILAVCLSTPFGSVLRRPLALAGLLFVVTVSHGVLDAMTDGGLGVAFFSPFNQQRFFFSWRPIHVSPIGLKRFFSNRGLRIMSSEILWIWCPTLGLIIAIKAAQLWRRYFAAKRKTQPAYAERTGEVRSSPEEKASGNPL